MYIADLWVYPAIFLEADEDDPAVKMNKEDFQAYLHTMFFLLKTDGSSIEIYEFVDSEEDEMEILISADRKTAEILNATFHVKIVAPDPDDTYEITETMPLLELVKVGKKWKFSGETGLLPFTPSRQ